MSLPGGVRVPGGACGACVMPVHVDSAHGIQRTVMVNWVTPDAPAAAPVTTAS